MRTTTVTTQTRVEEVNRRLAPASRRTRCTIARAYLRGHLYKPLDELTDEELLLVRGIGVKTLTELRKYIGEIKVNDTEKD